MAYGKELVDMKMAPKDVAAALTADKPEYPYGLRLELDNDALDKLGIKDLPPVGSYKRLYALAEVVSISQHESGDNGERRSVGLQIVKLVCQAVEGDEDSAQKPKRQPSDALYGTPEADNLKLIGSAE